MGIALAGNPAMSISIQDKPASDPTYPTQPGPQPKAPQPRPGPSAPPEPQPPQPQQPVPGRQK